VTPVRTLNLLRALFVSFTVCTGLAIGEAVKGSPSFGAAVGAVFGLAIVLLDRMLKGFSLRTFSSATFGLLLGFIFAQLLLASNILKYQDEAMRWISSLVVYATFGYLGMMLAIRSNRDEFSLVIPYVRFREASVQDAPLLIDTNIIIDGRIAQICATGFVSDSLVVPSFVLEELQRLADSAEPQKRERGRRGLDNLNQMQSGGAITVTIHESALDTKGSVDARLLQVANLLQARLLTNDLNLCKIARLQRVPVLSLNELAAALHPILNRGDELEITLVKEGREPHQAVGYLADGTMLVTNNANSRIGENVRVKIAGMLQTTGGRLFFAELAGEERTKSAAG
jgi:uncharacterized protein YacL